MKCDNCGKQCHESDAGGWITTESLRAGDVEEGLSILYKEFCSLDCLAEKVQWAIEQRKFLKEEVRK